MSIGIKTVTKKVIELLQEIDPTIVDFVGLEEKKISPALLAYTACATIHICESLQILNNTLNNIDKKLKAGAGRLYQDGEGV